MSDHDIVPSSGQLLVPGFGSVPRLFLDGGERSWFRFVEFFTAHIRNRNTRYAYARAVRQFCLWCDGKKLDLENLNPVVVAAYIEEKEQKIARPSVKQHLAAIRMLFDFLVVGQIVPRNPAASVRGPKHVVKKGKTPVLSAEEARQLLGSIETDTVLGLRDRALIATMVFSFARVSAVTGMNIEDYFPQGKRFWFRLHEKGGKRHDVPVHHKAEEYMDEYLIGAGLGDGKTTPLFRTIDRHRRLTHNRLSRREVLAMIKRRARFANLPANISCHTFRATGITTYLLNGGSRLRPTNRPGRRNFIMRRQRKCAASDGSCRLQGARHWATQHNIRLRLADRGSDLP